MKNWKTKLTKFLVRKEWIWSIPLLILLFILSIIGIQEFFSYEENGERYTTVGFISPEYIQALFLAGVTIVFGSFISQMGIRMKFKGIYNYHYKRVKDTNGFTINEAFAKCPDWLKFLYYPFLYLTFLILFIVVVLAIVKH